MSGVIYPINDKKYTAEDVEIFNCTRTSGVYSVLDFDYSLSGNVLTIGKGLAWIKNSDFSGKAIAFKDVTTITLDSADDTLDRYDVIAVRYDATKTEPEIVVIKGTASETPEIPTRSTESYLYELFLYSILRKAGEETATTSNITDLRESDYCGIMRDSVTSAVAPVYETIYEGSGLAVGKTLTFDYSKYAFVIATVYNSSIKVSCDVVLTIATPLTGLQTALSGSNFVMNTSGVSRGDIFFRAQIVIGSEGSTVDVCEYSNTSDFADVSGKACVITKLIGVTKQPEGYVKVDSLYNPESHNAQSGEAVKQAIDEALEGFTGGGGSTGTGGGINSTAINLLIDILQTAIYSANVSGKIEQLQNALASGSGGESDGGNSGGSDTPTTTDDITVTDGIMTIISVGSDISITDGIMTIL